METPLARIRGVWRGRRRLERDRQPRQQGKARTHAHAGLALLEGRLLAINNPSLFAPDLAIRIGFDGAAAKTRACVCAGFHSEAHEALRPYGTETRILSQAVKRNLERFPEDFMFQLSRTEIMRISQSVISLRDVKYSKVVHAFTEQGVAMLSSVLTSPQAVSVNIAIMRAFVRLREFLLSQSRLTKRLHKLEDQVTSHDEAIVTLFETMQELTSERPSAIGFQLDP